MILVWVGFLVLVGALVALELLLDQRRAQQVRSIDALASAGFWLGVSLLVNAAVFYIHHADPFGKGVTPLSGFKASQQFLATYAIEFALSLDNVVVIAAILAHFKVPRELVLRVLLGGVVAAVAVRGVMIAAGVGLLSTGVWAKYFFGVLLLISALRMILIRQENMDPERNLVVRAIRSVLGPPDAVEGRRFFSRHSGRLAPTLLFITLVMVETADAIFAFDSIPAGMAITRDPFILFSANVLAVLTTRSIYPILLRFTGWLRYFKVALTLVLLYLAAKMLMPGQMLDIHPEISLGVIFALITGGAVAAILGSDPSPERLTAKPSPLGEDAERVARLTLKQVRKLMILIVGTIVVLAGVGMLIGPGPGIVVIPIGLAILATEFVWAKRLLDRYAHYATTLGKRAGAEVMKRTRLWHVPVVIGLSVAGWLAVYRYTSIPIHTILMGALPMLIGQLVWGVMLYLRWRKQRSPAASPPALPPALPQVDRAVIRSQERTAG